MKGSRLTFSPACEFLLEEKKWAEPLTIFLFDKLRDIVLTEIYHEHIRLAKDEIWVRVDLFYLLKEFLNKFVGDDYVAFPDYGIVLRADSVMEKKGMGDLILLCDY